MEEPSVLQTRPWTAHGPGLPLLSSTKEEKNPVATIVNWGLNVPENTSGEEASPQAENREQELLPIRGHSGQRHFDNGKPPVPRAQAVLISPPDGAS